MSDWEPVAEDWTPADEWTPAEASWGETLKAIPAQILGGAEQAMGGIAQAVTAEQPPLKQRLVEQLKQPGPGMLLGGPLFEVSKTISDKAKNALLGEEGKAGLRDFGEFMFERGTSRIQEATPENQTFWQKAVSTAGVSAGTMIPAGAMAFVTRNPHLVAASFGAQEFGRAFGDAKAHGLDDATAMKHAVASGLIEAGTEYLPAKELFKKGSGPFKRLVNYLAKEIPGENAAELGQLASEYINGLEDDVTAQDVIDTIKLTTAATLIGGSAQSAVASGLEAIQPDQASVPPTDQPPTPVEKPELTLADIANRPDSELDALVDQFLAEDEQIDTEALSQQVADLEASEVAQQAEQVQQQDITEEDRRQDPEKRARVESLKEKVSRLETDVMEGRADPQELLGTIKELRTELTTDSLMQIPNRRAFNEHMESNPGEGVLFGDIDDFKSYNSRYGHEQTDKILSHMGEIMRELSQEMGVPGFRRSGDEFLAAGTPEQIEQYGAELQKRLANATVKVKRPDGTVVEHQGIGFSYGVGQNEELAEQVSAEQKQQRKAAGLRVGERDEPARLPDEPAAGQPDNRSDQPAPAAGDNRNQGLGWEPASSADQLISELEEGSREEGQKTTETEVLTKNSEQNLQPSGENGTRGTLFANPFAAVYQAYQQFGRKVLDRINAAYGWRFSPLGKLPAQDLYLKDRYQALGKIADTEEISTRVYETFRKLDGREAELVYEYLTTAGTTTANLSNKPVQYEWHGKTVTSTVKQQAEVIKRLIDRVGQNLVKAGLLHKDSYQKYQDAYLPRLYLKHLLGPDAARQFAGGKKPSDMGYLKNRKDIPQDVRELILGEITDPGYLASKSLGRSMRDLAVLDWFEQIAKNRDWALPDSLVQWQGHSVSVFWLKAEAARIREQIPHYKPQNQQRALQLVQQMDQVVQAAVTRLGRAPDDYRQAPDTPQYGRLRGMYIRKEIYNDIVGIPGNRDPHARWWESPFEYGGIGTKVTQLWKMFKVALNPPTQIRNFISNGILLQLSGVGSHRVLPLMIQAVQEIRQNGKHFRVAKKYGVTASTFANNELIRIERAFLDLKARNAGTLSLAQLRNIAGIIADGAGDLYQFSEALWKTAKIIDAMKREGKSESDAVLEAQKWLYDYSLVPQIVRYFRNTPIGVPFITFYFKTFPRMVEVLATAPHRFAPYFAIPALFTAAIASDYDVEPEDVEKLKLALPEWLRNHGHLFFLPFKDQHNRWQAFDFSYLLPWSMFEQAASEAKDLNLKGFVEETGALGGPVPDLLAAITTNVDGFTGKEIINPNDPPADQVKSMMNYLWSLAMPTWMTDNGLVGKMYEALYEVDKRTGEPKLTVSQAALRGLGLNIYPVEPEASRQRNLRFMQFELQELQKRMGERLRDKNLSSEDKSGIRKVFRSMIDEKRMQMQEYRKASRIHPNLKGQPVRDHNAQDDAA